MSSPARLAHLSALCLLAGCFSDPDVQKIVCRSPEYECPGGYVCRMVDVDVGRCCRPDDLSCPLAGLDGSASGEDVGQSSSSEAGASVDGQTLDGAVIDGAVIDAGASEAAMGEDGGPMVDTSATATAQDGHDDGPLLVVDADRDAPLLLPDGAIDVSAAQ